MQPVQLLYERGQFVLVHVCTGCGIERPNKASRDDDLSSNEVVRSAMSPARWRGLTFYRVRKHAEELA
jgi:hypothetical protein